MKTLTSRRQESFPVEAERLWRVVADFGALGEWWPEGLLERVDVEGEGVGMVRSIHGKGGFVLHEKLEALDDGARRLELSIVGDLPAGMSDYRARARVEAEGDASCRLEGEGRYQVATEEAESGARGFIEGAYAMMFAGLRAYTTDQGE